MPKRPSEVIAEQIRTLRTRHGWSQQQLADRMRDFGWEIDRGAIAKVELGQRGVTLDEGFVFALALDVAPVFLFLPLEEDEPTAIAPKLAVSPEDARVWFAGERPVGDQDVRFYLTEVPKRKLLERMEIYGWVDEEHTRNVKDAD